MDYNEEPKPRPTGTVKYHTQQMWLCTGDWPWPHKLEEGDGFPCDFIRYLNAKQVPIKISACTAPSKSPHGIDLLVFPKMIRYQNLTSHNYQSFLDLLLSDQPIPKTFEPKPIKGLYTFVCQHMTRDERCGHCGPPVIQAFEEVIKKMSLQDKVYCYGTSHISGHEYAANVIFQPAGEWYGYVNPAAVPSLLKTTLEGDIAPSLWRGRTGMTPEAQVILLKELGLDSTS